jgi:nucleotide-binding universal stress UspA family protein
MKPIESVLVHLDGGRQNGARLRAARRIADRLDASITAFYAVAPAFLDVPIEIAAGGSAAELMQEIDASRLAMARRVYDGVCSEPGRPIAWAASDEVTPIGATSRHALYADLLVLGQRDLEHGDPGVAGDFVQSVLISSGRPALVVPCASSAADIGSRVLVAWKESPQSARAVSAALPLLLVAREVHVATWSEGPTDSAAALGAWLRRHGIEARLHRQPAAGAEVGELMLSLAADCGADLIVAGCYGHTRARELVLGGATRTLLQSMTVPVLMAH